MNQNPETLKSNSYSTGSYGSINEPTAVNMKHDDTNEDFWAWGETGSKSQPAKTMANNEPDHKGSRSSLKKQESSDFDESWGWDDEFTPKPASKAKPSVNGKRSPNMKMKSSKEANGWDDDDWGQTDGWSNEDWSSVTPQKNNRKTIRSAGNGKKGD